MSVINKMLRDLDQRQATSTATQTPHSGLPAGTAVFADFAPPISALSASPRRARSVLLVLAGLVLALVIGASWWAAQRAAPSAIAADAATGPTAAPVAPVARVQPVASAPTTTLSPSSVLVAAKPAVSAPVLMSPQIAPTVVSLPLVAATPAAPPNSSVKREPTTLGLRMDTTLSPRKLLERVTVQERSTPPASELPKGPTPNEALERAQALWNTGSREAAIDLLHDAVLVAERAGAGSSFAQGNPVLLPLVRELTRMQLAESRHGAVWEVLTRLELQLGAAPDLWAIRGNAAQRLGRHQDSVHAYMAALQSRPNEQRWLLGAAVSLAALGQTRTASEMADKARAVGVVSPEVLAYLRQMGVLLKEK